MVDGLSRAEVLRALELVSWQWKSPATESSGAFGEGGSPLIPVDDSRATGLESEPVETLGWEALDARVASCRQCGLSAARNRTVFGSGDRSADWFFVGEGPGRDEDKQGLPFVGAAGALLTRMIQALRLQREQVYIANVVKCRPPGNRNPEPDEVAVCGPYLRRQIELVAPNVIVALGAVAARFLLDSDASVGRLRGSVHRYGPREIPLVVTYHPAYLLRKPVEKQRAWQDLSLAWSQVESEVL